MQNSLSKRLSAVASLVNYGSVLVDVGCDHGYIPVYLVLSGRVKSAIACDINHGPLDSCITLVNSYNLGDRIQCVLSDGLDNIDGDSVDDIVIAGMGGELIADILSRCDYASEKHLVLNPMTHPELARKWLYDNGYSIDNDIIVADAGHHYSIFDAHYTGIIQDRDDVDYFLGNINDYSDKEYFLHLLNYLRNKQKGGADYTHLIDTIEARI
ncbi:MAG: class I SAM-dependent methyltransferase [Eubacterium sp.]